MPQFKPITSDSEFKAKSFDEMMKPHLLVKAEYDEHMKMLDEQDKTLSDLEPYVGDGAARRIYDSMRGKMEEAADNFGTPFFLQNLPLIQGLKSQYNRTKSILGAAIKNQELERQHRQKLLDADDSLEFIYENGRGQFTEPNVDDFLMNGSPNFYRVSGKEVSTMMQNATRSFQGRLATASSSAYLTEENGMPGVRIRNEKKEGVSAYVQLDWLKNPEKHTKEIKDSLNMFYAHDPQQADAVYNAIMAGDMANEWNNVKSSTHYGKMTNDSKRRLDAWMDHGAFVGLNHYDENKNSSFSPHYPSNPGGSGGSGSFWNVNHIPVKTVTSPIKSVENQWENIKKGERMWSFEFNYDDPSNSMLNTNIWTGGQVRDFGSALWFDPSDVEQNKYRAKDEAVNSNIYRQSGLHTHVSMFDENGNLLTREQFHAKYDSYFTELRSKEYWENIQNNYPDLSEIVKGRPNVYIKYPHRRSQISYGSIRQNGEIIPDDEQGAKAAEDFYTSMIDALPFNGKDMTVAKKVKVGDKYVTMKDAKEGVSFDDVKTAFYKQHEAQGAEYFDNLHINVSDPVSFVMRILAGADKIEDIKAIKDIKKKEGNGKDAYYKPEVILKDEPYIQTIITPANKDYISFTFAPFQDHNSTTNNDEGYGIIMHYKKTEGGTGLYWIPLSALNNQAKDLFRDYYNNSADGLISQFRKKNENLAKAAALSKDIRSKLSDEEANAVANGDLTAIKEKGLEEDFKKLIEYKEAANAYNNANLINLESIVKRFGQEGIGMNIVDSKVEL